MALFSYFIAKFIKTQNKEWCKLITFKNVYKTYDNGTEGLRDFSLEIDKGEFVFVVGASGAGKSTFIKALLREEDVNSGQIVVGDYDIRKIKRREIPAYRRTLGVVFQDFRLIPTMTVYENVAFALRVTNVSKRYIRKRVPYVLGILGLTKKMNCYPNEISGGEQQRVALARALANNPKIIVADEPTGNIDPELSFEIVELLSEINKTGTTVVMVTHEHELVYRFNHRVVTIEKGSVISDTKSSNPLKQASFSFSEQEAINER